jgi:glutamate synthase (NADPH/NADH) small chain
MSINKEFLHLEREKEWRVELRKKIASKERTNRPRTRMPEMEPYERIKYQDREVNTGLSESQAQLEASRCLDCINPTCIEGCPVSINIPKFIKYIELGNYLDAAKTLKEKRRPRHRRPAPLTGDFVRHLLLRPGGRSRRRRYS